MEIPISNGTNYRHIDWDAEGKIAVGVDFYFHICII
jgi:hypothetical protein